MRLLPFARRDVSPLSPGIEALLRGAPRATAPDGLKTALLAAYERRSPAPPVASLATWKTRLAVPLATLASAAAVLAIGVTLRSRGADGAEWVQMHPSSIASNPPVRVVEKPSLDALGSAVTLLAAAPMEGP